MSQGHDNDPARRGDADAATDACVQIERLAAGGDGVGHLPDGLAVFVPLTAPGDRVRVRVEERRRRWARARVLEILAPGPGRTDPVCPVFGECGGCAWQHLSGEVQLEAKRDIVVDALRRIGHLDPPEDLVVTPSPRSYGYRSRARLHAQHGRIGYRRRRSHDLCAVEHCPILTPELDARLARMARRPPRTRSGDVELLEETVRVGGDELRISPGVFSQGNALLVSELAAAVARAAGEGERAVELFAGAGTLTLGLARRFRSVVAVEGSGRAAADLRANLAAAGLEAGVEIRTGRVEVGLDALLAAALGVDCVVLDPPRSGLPPGTAERVAALEPDRIVYLSCDPATLARDLAALRAAASQPLGLAAVEAFDLFPQTPHVEVLAVLAREERRAE